VISVIIACGFFASSCGSGDSSTDVQVVTPRITSLSATTLSAGDTLNITGSGFATPASSNTVVFNNSLATVPPFSATDTRLIAVVPQNANSGPLYVTSKGVKSNAVVVEVDHGVGDVWVMGGGSMVQFKVPVTTGTEEYVIIPESATSSGVLYPFQVIPDTASVFPAPPMALAASNLGTLNLPIRFETSIREQAIEYLRTHTPENLEPRPQITAAEPPATRQFYVLKCTSCSSTVPGSFALVTATLQYDGTHVLIYSDDNQPTGSFTPAEYAAFGAQFDADIYPTDTTYFGDPTDIDANTKVIVLFTPIVNDLTPDGTAFGGFISGFFFVNDLGSFPAGTTNRCEMFYTMVPDPNAEYGNAFSKALVESVVPGTLAHEFEHMISIGYRLVVLGGGSNFRYLQQTWLEEGMAHMAEDLNDMDDQNIGRGGLFLQEVSMHSLLGNAELRPYVDTLEQRGGIFLFLRYLGDQLGDQIFKPMAQGPEVGTATVQKVTEKEFYSSVADFLAALYLDDRPGIPHDPKYDYTSFNMQVDFANKLATSVHEVQFGAFAGNVRSATGSFSSITGAGSPALDVRVSSGSTSQMRVVVIRTK
jgi:hypothetical protein